MCITRNNQDETIPYNKSRIRWKSLYVGDDGHLYSRVYNHKWKFGVNHKSKALNDSRVYGRKWKFGVNHKSKALNDSDPSINYGFHVWLTRKQAVRLSDHRHVIAKVRVDGHIFSGMGNGRKRNETWKRAKLVAVYTRSGRNVTHRYTNKKKGRKCA